MNGWLRPARVVLLAFAMVLACTAAQADAATLFNLGGFAPSGLNGKDQVVGDIVNFADDSDDPPYFPGIWQRTGGLTRLTSSGAAGDANAISETGRIAGTEVDSLDETTSSATHAVTWASPTASPIQIGPLDDSANDNKDASYANDVDNAGDAVGQTPDAKPYFRTAFLKTGSLQPIGRPDNPTDSTGDFAGQSEALGITPDGNTVLGHVDAVDTDHPATYYLWHGTGSSGTPLDITPIKNGDAAFGGFDYGSQMQNDLASDGTVLGYTGSSNGGPRYLRLPSGSEIAVPGLSGYNAVNAKHTIAGTVLPSGSTNPLDLRAEIRKANGDIVDLNSLLPASDSDIQLFDALAINDNGDVAGIAFNKSTMTAFGFLLKMGYVVDSTGDQPDAHFAAGDNDGECLTAAGTCTLRAAIQQADADGGGGQSSISFDITSGVTPPALPKITPATALPTITAPVEIDGTTQPTPLVAGTRKIGVIIDGSGISGAGTNGLDLTSGAAGSLIHGVQVQKFTGDGVKLGGANSQLADSVLYKDATGAEVAAAGATVGAGNALPGNIFFADGNGTGLFNYLKGLKPHSGDDTFANALPTYGGGVLLTATSSGAQVKGNLIGVHGDGFDSASADQLDPDGFISTVITSGPGAVLSFGVLVDPVGSTVSNVTIGGSGADANTISGTGFGVAANTGTGGSVVGLSVLGNTFGPGADGSPMDPFGGLFGLLASGSVSGLQVGSPTAGNTFQGELFAATIAGQNVTAPQVFGNTIGTTSGSLPNVKADGLGAHNLAGLVLADTTGAQVGGTAPGQANQIVGNYLGLLLGGDHLSNDTISGNTIGTSDPPAFGSFAKTDLKDFKSLFGVLYSGNAVAGTNAPAQNLTFDHNAIQGSVFGMLSSAATGMTLQNNTFTANAFGLLDGGSGGSRIGTAGQGNTFADDGFGVFLANTDPNPDEAKHANVNPDLTTAETKDSGFVQADEDVALDTVNAITTSNLGSDSTVTSTVPGTGTSVLGNTFGVDGGGATKPITLPVVVAGDEHGVKIGGLGAGEGNAIQHSRAGGIWMIGAGSHEPTAQILGNTLYDNENFTEVNAVGVPGLGIDLITGDPATDADSVGGFGFGVNPQDQTQPDVGPDNDQNAPVITTAQTSGSSITVAGTLHGAASTNYVLEVYADDNQNPYGAGEGQRLLGRPTLTTDASGNATFSQDFTAPPSSARFVSATATTVPGGGDAGVTSEFAVNTQITAAGSPPPPAVTPAPTPVPGPTGAATTGVTTSGTGTSVKTSGLGPITIPAIVTCASAVSSNCTVTTQAKVVTKASGSRASITAIAAKATKKKPKTTSVTVGHGAATLKPGASGSISFTLSASGKKLLLQKKSLTVTVTVTVTGQGRKAVTKTFTVKLKYVAPKKKSTKKKSSKK